MLLSVMSVFQMYQMKVCLLCAAYILYLYQQPIPRAVSILEVGGGTCACVLARGRMWSEGGVGAGCGVGGLGGCGWVGVRGWT